MTPKCNNMARSTGISSDSFCAIHSGTINSFEKLTARISDPTEFAGVLKYKDGLNWSKITKVGSTGIGGALVVTPLAVLAAPALGGLVGSALLGYSGAVATSAGLAFIGGGSIAAGGFGMVGGTCVVSALGGLAGTAAGGFLANAYLGDIRDFRIDKIRDGKDPALILVDGFLTEKTGEEKRWISGLGSAYGDRAIYHVKWESKRLHDIGKMITTGAIQSSIEALIREAAKKATQAASQKILPLTIPFALMGVAKNPWIVAMIKAEKTGELLKEMIARCDDRSFILVGHSLGARVVYRALASFGTISDDMRRSRIVGAYLLGGAVGSEPADAWSIAAKAVDEKIYSYYSANDMVLKTLYRVGTLFCSKAIGRQPIPTNLETSARIESIDVTREVSGHTRYHENLQTIISEI